MKLARKMKKTVIIAGIAALSTVAMGSNQNIVRNGETKVFDEEMILKIGNGTTGIWVGENAKGVNEGTITGTTTGGQTAMAITNSSNSEIINNRDIDMTAGINQVGMQVKANSDSDGTGNRAENNGTISIDGTGSKAIWVSGETNEGINNGTINVGRGTGMVIENGGHGQNNEVINVSGGGAAISVDEDSTFINTGEINIDSDSKLVSGGMQIDIEATKAERIERYNDLNNRYSNDGTISKEISAERVESVLVDGSTSDNLGGGTYTVTLEDGREVNFTGAELAEAIKNRPIDPEFEKPNQGDPSNPIRNTEKLDEVKANISEAGTTAQSAAASYNQRLGQTRSEMKGIGAQSAAMTASAVSATQQLEVGEVGVGVGHGSYADQNAQSFSLGVRPTENVNMNASWSHSDSNSDMWSVGAGYKFNVFGK